jgi:hypothetical protein
MDQDPFNLEQLRVDSGLASPRRKWRRRFVLVPWVWVERLRETKRVSTYRIGLVLLYENWRSGGRAIALSNVLALREGLSGRSKWRAIAELESLGLIQVKRHQRRSPRVVLQHLKPEPT